MNLEDAQKDMRRAYVNAGPGILISGLIWIATGIVEIRSGPASAFATLFLASFLIFPLAKFIDRFLFGRANELPDNKLGLIAFESVIAMIGGFVPAFLALKSAPDFVFPFAALAVGTHYFVFRTLYGDMTFWLLGGAITTVALLGLGSAGPLPLGVSFLVGIIELLFAGVLIGRSLTEQASADVRQ